MKGLHLYIEGSVIANRNYRKVVYTAEHSQLVLMSLLPGEEIGEETHQDNDQFFRIEEGHGICHIDENEYEFHDGDAIIVPAGAKHNVKNTSESRTLKLYTIYSPPHHKDGLIRVTKMDADVNGQEFDGVTTELN
jgi:mannose-6-phosphate isomerase-like protein (cupin superfamily)